MQSVRKSLIMIITNVRIVKKGNVLVYADNEYLISLSPEIFVKSKLKVGSYIDEEIIKEISADSNAYKAKEKALRLLSFRAHSKKELETKIKRSLDEDSARKATEKMEKLGLINDAGFAKSYAKELSSRKYYSINRIKYELAHKGVEKLTISEVLNELDINEDANALKFLENKYSQKLNDEKGRRKAVSALQRLGYSWSQISSAIKTMQ